MEITELISALFSKFLLYEMKTTPATDRTVRTTQNAHETINQGHVKLGFFLNVPWMSIHPNMVLKSAATAVTP